jgi:peptidoglycan/LPS O-acetylase OafA/YrhL
MRAKRSWLLLLVAVCGAGLVFATLGPVGWQLRTGLHWLIEHFAVFFTVTVLACAVWPRPMRVAAVMLPLAVGLEAAQALTPDRTADPATALAAAAAVSLAALSADAVLLVRKKRRKA